MFKVIIAGGRDFDNYELLKSTMDKLLSNKPKDDICIVCGKARGADTLGEYYAKERGYQIDYYPAQWDKYGTSAGFMRNCEMARESDALVAFWDGASKGTRHMIDVARRYHLQVRVKRYIHNV